MPSERTHFATDAPLPETALSPAGSESVRTQWEELLGLRTSALWAGLESLWRSERAALRSRLASAKPADFERLRAELDAVGLPGEILADAEMLAWRAKQAAQPHVLAEDPTLTQAQAEALVREAEVVREAVKSPALQAILARCAARAWAHWDLMRAGQPEDLPRHKAFMQAALRPIRILQRALDRGTVAASWIERTARRESQEVSNG